FLKCVAAATVVGLAVGCSSKPTGASVPPAETDLQDVNNLLRSAGHSGHLAAQLSDVERNKGNFHRGYEAVKSGKVVVIWGAPTQGEGAVGKDEKVVAYEKDTPTSGG